MKKFIFGNEKDVVVTCCEDLLPGDEIRVGDKTIIVKEKVDQYHKMAIYDIKKGSIIYKYGEAIGVASKNISMGEHVHIQNVESIRGRGDKEAGDLA